MTGSGNRGCGGKDRLREKPWARIKSLYSSFYFNMFSEYIQAALMQAEYDTLEDGSYVATVPGLQGVIAVGDTFEGCRTDLIEVIEEWIVARLQWGHPIPPIGGQIIASSKEPITVVD